MIDEARAEPDDARREAKSDSSNPGVASGPRRTPWITVALAVLVSIAVLAGWFAFYGLVLTGFQEHATQFRLYGQLRSELAQETAPLGGPIASGSPVALISIPSVGLKNAVVVEGTNSQELTKGPGHLSDTPLPGQPGVSVIFGRSTTFGAPFSGIDALPHGARIDLTTGQGEFIFQVDRVRHAGSRPRPAVGPGVSEITLVSSDAKGWRSGFAPNHTVLVDATLTKGKLQQAPPGLPSRVNESSQPMHGMRPAVVPLIFWLLGLLLLPGVAMLAWKRWGRWQTWMAGVPIAVALLWGATLSGQVLLPNLI